MFSLTATGPSSPDLSGQNLPLVYLAGKLLQQQFLAVVEEDVLDGTLANDHKAVLLTSLDYLAPRVVAALEDFAKGGGLVLLTGDCTVTIKGGGLVTSTTMSGAASSSGTVTISNGGSATADTIDGWTVTVSSGGTASGNTLGYDTTAAKGATLNVKNAGTVNATENWWGCAKGPGSPGCSSVSGPNVVSTPFLTNRADAPSPQ